MSTMVRLFALVAVSLVACTPSPPRIQVDAEPVTVSLGEGAHTTLRVTSAAQGMEFQDGPTRAFTLRTDYGSFVPNDGDPSQDVRETRDVEVAAHVASLKLYGDAVPPADGFAHVTVTYVDEWSRSTTASIDVSFRPDGDVGRLTFSCATYNIGAFMTAETDWQLPCSVGVTTEDGKPVFGAPIKLEAEAGNIRFVGQRLYYFPKDPTAADVAPRDVNPTDLENSAEPYRTGPDGKVHNPRDGLVTLMAWVPASAEVVNRQLLPEPFVDWNDNGVCDGDEPHVELNGDRKWNELQDDRPEVPHALWKQIKVLWTGRVAPSDAVTARVEPPCADVFYGGSQLFVFQGVVDENFNVLASNDPAHDGITWIVTPEPDVSLGGGQPAMDPLASTEDPRRLGMLLDDNFNFVDASRPESWMMRTSALVHVENTMVCQTPLREESFTVEGRITRSLALTEAGVPTYPVTETTLMVSGTLQPPPESFCSP